MAAASVINGVAIIEKDADNEFIFNWVYPKIDSDLKDLFKEKCFQISDLFHDCHGVNFFFGQYENIWYYIVGDKSINKLFSETYLVAHSQTFNPELYKAICSELLKSYAGDGTTKVLVQYLSLFTKGFCICSNSSKLAVQQHDQKKAYAETCVKELISLFGMEVILIYMAVLLKKHIVVYASKLSMLMDVCRCLPVFALHRLNWNIVYPFIDVANEKEIAMLREQRAYVCGVTDAAVESRTELYDLFVNIVDGEITINPDSKDFFQMGSLHKDIATYLVESASNENVGDDDIVREVSRRTKELIHSLRSLDHSQTITMEILKAKNLSTAMQTFLFNLASAEGFGKLH